MLKKPKRPWKNLEHARKEFGIWQPSNTTHFPCLTCGGRGGYRDVKDLDPIEGYKMASFYKCRTCDGFCVGYKAAFVEYYRITKYKRELAIYQQKINRFRELKKQLSKEDLEILQECL